MHYAEFAEDEVLLFSSPAFRLIYLLFCDLVHIANSITIVHKTSRGNQGLRSEQMEGHRAESWQACKGAFNLEIKTLYTRSDQTDSFSLLGLRTICQGALQEPLILEGPMTIDEVTICF